MAARILVLLALAWIVDGKPTIAGAALGGAIQAGPEGAAAAPRGAATERLEHAAALLAKFG